MKELDKVVKHKVKSSFVCCSYINSILSLLIKNKMPNKRPSAIDCSNAFCEEREKKKNNNRTQRTMSGF